VSQAFHKVSYLGRPYLVFLALHGQVRFAWDWLIAVSRLNIWPLLAHAGVDVGLNGLIEHAVNLGYDRLHATQAVRWTLTRVVLHAGFHSLRPVTDDDVNELLDAIVRLRGHTDLPRLFGSDEQYARLVRHYRSHLHLMHVTLYHAGQARVEPHRTMPLSVTRVVPQPQMQLVIDRYVATRKLTARPATIERIEHGLRIFCTWLAEAQPHVQSFAHLTRDQVLAYADALNTMRAGRTGQPVAAWSKLRRMSVLAVFFRDVAAWAWEDVPPRPLLGPGDLPKVPARVPRYIPDDELARLMAAVRTLACPFQRTALLIARWSGARRNEIRRLAMDCLDAYPDGTPRLRLPPGKTKQERLVPLNPEAAAAIQSLQQQRTGVRGFRDDLTGLETPYLFMYHGKLLSANYLFDTPLTQACQAAGLLTADGKRAITPHRFRHTVGTQLAEKGAKLHTIMKVLGHTSPGMSMVYTHLSDQTVLKDYQQVLGPGTLLAGPAAEAIRDGELAAEAIDWLKTNFFKTELELGHCLRLPQEGPCECDLYLTCAKFVTTPAYADRLRQRRMVELALIDDAAARGWAREVERHRCVVQRLEQVLEDLGEPIVVEHSS